MVTAKVRIFYGYRPDILTEQFPTRDLAQAWISEKLRKFARFEVQAWII